MKTYITDVGDSEDLSALIESLLRSGCGLVEAEG
jgi:hypothetical protein